MKKLITILFLTFAFALAAHAQTEPQTVTVSKEAAVKCLENGDKVAALTDELKVKTQAIADLNAAIQKLEIELAKMSGQLTGAQSEAVSQRAIIQLLLQNVKKKRIGLINIF